MADAGLKAMVPFERPFLDYLLHNLADSGISRACVVIGPAHEAVRDYYARLATRRIAIEFAVQHVAARHRRCGGRGGSVHRRGSRARRQRRQPVSRVLVPCARGARPSGARRVQPSGPAGGRPDLARAHPEIRPRRGARRLARTHHRKARCADARGLRRRCVREHEQLGGAPRSAGHRATACRSRRAASWSCRWRCRRSSSRA